MAINILAEIQQFEQETNSTLPKEYIQFLSNNFSKSQITKTNNNLTYNFEGIKHDLGKQCSNIFSNQYISGMQEGSVSNFVPLIVDQKNTLNNGHYREFNSRITFSSEDLQNECPFSYNASQFLQLLIDSNIQNISITSDKMIKIVKELHFLPIAYKDQKMIISALQNWY